MDIIREIAILPFPKPDNYHGTLSKWVKVPSQQLVKNFLLFGYFLLIGGFIYDIQNQPSGMGQYVDPITGLMRPMTFLQGRINGQFIIEGFAASVVIAVGTFGFIIIDHANKPGIQRRSRLFMMWSGFISIISSIILLNIFISSKMANYSLF
jgi:hypothetical protein